LPFGKLTYSTAIPEADALRKQRIDSDRPLNPHLVVDVLRGQGVSVSADEAYRPESLPWGAWLVLVGDRALEVQFLPAEVNRNMMLHIARRFGVDIRLFYAEDRRRLDQAVARLDDDDL
jgi:hypothetical protein